MTDTLTQERDLTHRLVEVIARLRQENHFTLEDLADLSGLHRTSLGLIERGERGLTIATAERLARALDLPLSGLLAIAEASEHPAEANSPVLSPRRLSPSLIRNEQKLIDACGLDGAVIRGAIEYVYDTFDLIDTELMNRGSEPVSGLVELANLSSMIGNLVGAGVAVASRGTYLRNRPHAFPDLVPQRGDLPEIEIKMALETNRPKGHLAKAGVYLTFRYVLGNADGTYARSPDKTLRGRTAWIYEVRIGRLELDDFDLSNTPGDSGKTATIKTESFKKMTLVFFDEELNPYAKPWGNN